jgi:hypothetical protein
LLGTTTPDSPLKIAEIVYLNTLVQVFRLKPKIALRTQEQWDGATAATAGAGQQWLLEHVLNQFFRCQKKKEVMYFTRSKEHTNKLICWIIILAFRLSNYVLDPN